MSKVTGKPLAVEPSPPPAGQRFACVLTATDA
jgi:hypothetical protein